MIIRIISLNSTTGIIIFLFPKESDDRKVTLEGGDVMVVTQGPSADRGQ